MLACIISGEEVRTQSYQEDWSVCFREHWVHKQSLLNREFSVGIYKLFLLR